MNLFSRIYIMLATVVVMVLSPMPYSAVAIALFLLQAYFLWKTVSPRVGLPLILLSLALLPLTFKAIIPQPFSIASAFIVIPAIPLLDWELRRNAQGEPFIPLWVGLTDVGQPTTVEGRKPTPVFKAMALFLSVVLVIALLLGDYTMSLTVALLAAYLLALTYRTMHHLSTTPLESTQTEIKVVAGETKSLSGKAWNHHGMPLRAKLSSPYPWVRLTSPTECEIKDEVSIEAFLTPPLAGPSQLLLQASILDPWGLIQTNQRLELAEMIVIPRARYAEWLARRYLAGEAGRGGGTATIISTKLRYGAKDEYYSSRLFQPGDSLINIDWKHTAKLRSLVVKEYLEAPRGSVVVVVNLAVSDAEAADKLALNLVSTVMTLARNSIPVILAAYNHQEVIEVTPTMPPTAALEKALQLIPQIIIVELGVRFLQPPNIQILRQTLNRLKEAETEAAKKLAALLELEYRAICGGAENHPAAQALQKVSGMHPLPSAMIVLSSCDHDAEALSITLGVMRRRGCRVEYI